MPEHRSIFCNPDTGKKKSLNRKIAHLGRKAWGNLQKHLSRTLHRMDPILVPNLRQEMAAVTPSTP